MVRNDIHRSYVLPLTKLVGKIKDTGWFCYLQSLSVVVQGYGRKLFFACSGNGNGSSWNNRGSNGNYWSASFNSARNARNLNFNSGGVNPQNNNNRYNGYAVRAVQHTFLTILLLIFTIYGINTAAAPTRPLSGFLRCETTQKQQKLCKVMGIEFEAEYGRFMQRFVQSDIQASSIEMFHSRLSKEARDICGNVQRPNRTSSVFQLHSWFVREDVYSRHIQLYRWSWNTLRNKSRYGFLSQGESELAEEMLCHALGYSRLFHAHCQEEIAGGCHCLFEENGFPQSQQRFRKEVVRHFGYELCGMAYRNHCYARPQGKLYNMWRFVGLGWLRPCEVYAKTRRWCWSPNWQSYESAFFKCVHECFRPICKARPEMPFLWQVCGRCGFNISRQGVVAIGCTRYTEIPKVRIGFRLTHGETGDFRSSSWSRVPWGVYQTIQNVYIQSLVGAYEEENCGIRLFEPKKNSAFREQLLGYLPTYCLIPSEQEVAAKKGNNALRYIYARYDKDDRQIFIL